MSSGWYFIFAVLNIMFMFFEARRVNNGQRGLGWYTAFALFAGYNIGRLISASSGIT